MRLELDWLQLLLNNTPENVSIRKRKNTMAIRFKYDAAAVVIPPSASKKKYGQDLVLQQQKYALDQKNTIQERMYDQQKQGMQNQFQWGQDRQKALENADAAVLANTNDNARQKTLLDANQKAAQQLADMAAQKRAKDDAERLAAQKRAGIEQDIKSGAIDPITGAKIRDSYRSDIDIDLDDGMDAGQKAEFHGKQKVIRDELEKNRIPIPTMTEKLNQGVKWKNPETGLYDDPNDRQKFPDGKRPEGWDIVDLNPEGSSKSQKQTPSLPPSYEEYTDLDEKQSRKDLEAKMEALWNKGLGPGGTKYADDDALEDAAYAELKGRYERGRARSAAAKQLAAPALGQPSQAGQAPPAAATTAPPAEQPAPYMQDLEPTYNQDGTTSTPGQPAMPPPTPWLSQAATEAAAATATSDPTGMQPPQNAWSEFAAADAAPPLPDAQAIANTLSPQGVPVNARQDAQPQAAQSQASATTSSVPTLDFNKLVASATDDADRTVFGKLQGMYEKQSPDIQKAIGVLVDPGSDPKLTAQAYEYLKSKGIDVSKLARTQTGTGTSRLNEYQNNSTTTMR